MVFVSFYLTLTRNVKSFSRNRDQKELRIKKGGGANMQSEMVDLKWLICRGERIVVHFGMQDHFIYCICN